MVRYDMVPEKLKKSLREYLDNNKLTQRELAEKLDITEAAVSRYVTGTRIPSLETVIRIARVTGISLDEMVRELPETG